ncbi:MAG: OsmC family protein [Lautropia sp.]
MATLNDYLAQKRDALTARKGRIEAGQLGATALAANVRIAGRSGIREIRIRDHAVITDSPPDFAGYDLGPSSPELQLGVLGSCVAHIYLIHAADQQVPIESLDVEVRGTIDPRAGSAGHEQTPVWPHDIGYTVRIDSNASDAALRTLHETVERLCPILNLLRNPQSIESRLERIGRIPAEKAA